jgi:hypothetical protein
MSREFILGSGLGFNLSRSASNIWKRAVISTQDEDVIASIIKATNRQTEVKEEQLLAISEFQKKLEAYFQTFENGKRLYYERRSRQYNSAAGIEKNKDS